MVYPFFLHCSKTNWKILCLVIWREGAKDWGWVERLGRPDEWALGSVEIRIKNILILLLRVLMRTWDWWEWLRDRFCEWRNATCLLDFLGDLQSSCFNACSFWDEVVLISFAQFLIISICFLCNWVANRWDILLFTLLYYNGVCFDRLYLSWLLGTYRFLESVGSIPICVYRKIFHFSFSQINWIILLW